MGRILLRLLAAALLCSVAYAVPPAAEAWTGACTQGGPTCHFWKGKVTFVADGDTIRVDVAGDATSAPRTVRLTGINTMELRRYSKYPGRRRGACHAVEPTALIERYVRRARGVVRLSAQDPASASGGRLRRSVAVRVGGAWLDLGRILMEQGHALWLPNGIEHAHNHEYHRLAEQAAARRRNLYDPAYCGSGPDQDADLGMRLNWDAQGDDGANPNGEWVELRNAGGKDVSLAGWWFRDSRLARFTFPPYAMIPAGGSLRLHVGCGPNSPDRPARLHWCERSPVFENVRHDGRHMGDGGYLFDPQGDLRLSMTYPCVYQCEHRLPSGAGGRIQDIDDRLLGRVTPGAG